MSWSGVGEIFNPGQRHLREEMDRKQIEAKIPGNEGDGETQVDLENNVVRIPQPRPKTPGPRQTPRTHRRRRRRPRTSDPPRRRRPGRPRPRPLSRERLTAVEGVVGVVLGGSRARGEHTPDSDVDLGLYYQGDLDIAALAAIARDVAGPDAEVTERGELGAMGRRRRLAGGRTASTWTGSTATSTASGRRGHERTAAPTTGTSRSGHPLGVPDFAYVGELALAVVLADPDGDLTDLRDAITYPDALRTALARNLWEADFLLQIAAKATSRGDAAYVALCLSRAMLLCAHALHAHDRRWLVNEKGAIASAGRLPCAPTDFERRVCGVLGSVGTSPAELAATIENATRIVEEVRAVWTNET